MTNAPVRRARALIARAVQDFFADGCPLRAAAIAYYGLFSLFPLAILIVGGFGIVIGEAEARRAVIDFLLDNLPLEPGQGRRDLEELLGSVTGNAAAFGLIGTAGLIFAASGLMGAVRDGTNAAFDSERRRPPLQGKLVDILLVLGVGLVVAGSLALTVVTSLVEVPGGIPVGWLVPLAISFAVFLLLYHVLPAGRPRFRDVWPGAVLATVGYEAAKEAFSLYLENFSRYGAVYGAIGAVIAFLVFAFIAANLFLLGAETASKWPAVREADLEELERGQPAVERVRRALRGLVSNTDD